jgi:acetoin utilization deacetylase AcuC-like enzyme
MEQLENAERAEIVMNSPFGIIHRRSLNNLVIDRNPPAVGLGDIVRVHDSNYIGEIKRTCAMLDDTEMIEYDGDTHLSAQTWEASVYGAGACVEACKKIMEKNAKNAF